jgi:integrase
MARTPEPWYWVDRDAWYVTVDGKRHQLAKGKANKAEARRAFHRLMAEGAPKVGRPDLTVELAADLFLEHSRREHTPGTFEQHRIKLQSLCDSCGKVKASDLRPSHVSKWLVEKGWADATRRGAITSVKAALNWCVREGLLAENPIARLERPKMTRRTRTLSPTERATVADAATDDAFRDLLIALAETGARPGELARLEASMIDWGAGMATMPGKTSRKTGRPRTIVLTPRMLALCRQLAETRPEGPLFRNGDGNPWTPNAIRCRFRRLRERTGLGKVVAYTFRHSFATDALERGVPIASVAELLGHSDTKMVSGHYSHLDERHEHLRRAGARAAGDLSE